MAYTTTALVKTYLDISGSGDDTLIGTLVVRAQAMIDAYCNRTFEASADAERNFDAVADVDGLVLYLDEDLCAITTVTNGDGDTIASTKYVTEPRNETPYYALRLLGSSDLAWEENSTTDDPEDAITIDGKWAYSESAPDDIVHACIRLAAYLYRQRDNAADLDRPVVAGNVTILPGQMPRDLQMILEPYRRLWNF